MENLETKTVIEVPTKENNTPTEPTGGLLDSYTGFIMGGVVILAGYLGRRSLYLWEKKKNIVDGSYAKLLKNPKSDFYHKLFLLGKPSEAITDYLRQNPEE